MVIPFDLGEVKHVYVEIVSRKNESFTILSATWKLFAKGGDTAESSGACLISDHILDSCISPQSTGNYTLKLTYSIADETLIAKVPIVVTN